MFKDNNKIKLDFLAKFFPLEKKSFQIENIIITMI